MQSPVVRNQTSQALRWRLKARYCADASKCAQSIVTKRPLTYGMKSPFLTRRSLSLEEKRRFQRERLFVYGLVRHNKSKLKSLSSNVPPAAKLAGVHAIIPPIFFVHRHSRAQSLSFGRTALFAGTMLSRAERNRYTRDCELTPIIRNATPSFNVYAIKFLQLRHLARVRAGFHLVFQCNRSLTALQ
jgi:hypothetical protein